MKFNRNTSFKNWIDTYKNKNWSCDSQTKWVVIAKCQKPKAYSLTFAPRSPKFESIFSAKNESCFDESTICSSSFFVPGAPGVRPIFHTFDGPLPLPNSEHAYVGSQDARAYPCLKYRLIWESVYILSPKKILEVFNVWIFHVFIIKVKTFGCRDRRRYSRGEASTIDGPEGGIRANFQSSPDLQNRNSAAAEKPKIVWRLLEVAWELPGSCLKVAQSCLKAAPRH